MIQLLDRKIRQMHESLGNLSNSDLSSLKIEQDINYIKIDFSQNKRDSELYNIASLLVNNIACMKDHLKVWCSKNNKKFNGDNLINTNKSVAIIHDLWNIDKHAKLTQVPRSGFIPKIINLKQSLQMSSGTQACSSAFFMLDSQTGKIITKTENGGSISLVINGEIIDENTNNSLGDFYKICEDSVYLWEKELEAVGITISKVI